ncbi:MAG: carbohydrate ABC transporter permease [Spirochaetes bacterium]|nr:MAG: carbohydrate ABC transporter permease [Spirochaetota bacterium]
MRMGYRAKRAFYRFTVYAILLIVGVIILFPFYWMVSTAFKPRAEIVKRPPTFFPENPTIVHFKNVFAKAPYFRNLYNSLFISGMTTVISIFFSTMAGYAIARYRCIGLNFIFMLILSALMIPPFIIAIPLYMVAAQVGLVNTLWGVIVPFSISNFGIFMMRQFTLGVPEDLISSARIDGASEFKILIRIIFPVVASGCAALGILKFLVTWNDLFWPLLMLTRDDKKTLTVMLATFIDFQRFIDYGLLMACTTLVVLPVIVLFVFFQRRIIEGVAISGMKG